MSIVCNNNEILIIKLQFDFILCIEGYDLD
jgi:hypothetical protein